VPLLHHELCFGCGRQNLFGLLAELEADGGGRVTGRCFIKQDHQGPEPGVAHPGLVATALLEAMSLAAGRQVDRLQLEFEAGAPVGAFLELEATGERATASLAGQPVARAVASYRRRHGLEPGPSDPGRAPGRG
jgi:hypothetical protein